LSDELLISSLSAAVSAAASPASTLAALEVLA
jgi:hypothetical protein